MATADVLPPELPEVTANSLAPGAGFTFNVPIPVTSSTTQETTEVKKAYFALNSQHFIDLQIYLLAGLRLPATTAKFDEQYPFDLFKEYTDKDAGPPELYKFMKDTLVEIHQHCFDFQSKTLGPMIGLAGEIAGFAEKARKTGLAIHQHMNTITADGATTSGPAVAKAIEDTQFLIFELQDAAETRSKSCKGYVEALSTFRTTTKIDSDNLTLVNKRSNVVLPTPDQLNVEMRTAMENASKSLQDLAKDQNRASATARANSGPTWYCALGIVGLGFAIARTVDNYRAVNNLQEANNQYATILSNAGAKLGTTLKLRSRCFNLMGAIDRVYDAIAKAEKALTDMMGEFSKIQTGLGPIAEQLSGMKGYVGNAIPDRRKLALKKLEEAAESWGKVVDLAGQFQANGLLMEADMTKPIQTAEAPPQILIKGCNYGSKDVTDAAKVLFWDGDNIRIRSVEPGFPEAWEGNTKTISILHTYGDSKRIFVCAEFTGTHSLKPGDVSLSRDSSSEVMEIKQYPKPSGSAVTILAIVYGKKVIDNISVYQYAYARAGKQDDPIKWRNENFGGDSWSGHVKSGTIYYTVGTNETVQQVSGREWTDTVWNI